MTSTPIKVNYDRNIYCILGLTFDSISMQDALSKVRLAAQNKTPCFISTPNLNFLINSLSDRQFKYSVINSDLSLADGMPIIWIARFLKIPISERVPGSGLFEKLREPHHPPLKVFFFGGPDGIAELACNTLINENQGATGVGFETPGFGTIDEMSAPKILDKINASHADFLLVALGAKKGQAWIEANRTLLNTPIISHLGAVVNFVAGNIKRAPNIFQSLGIEWLWRIYQEPNLWKRYFNDAIEFSKLFFGKILPYAIWIRMNQQKLLDDSPLQITQSTSNGISIIKLSGPCTEKSIKPLRQFLTNLFQDDTRINKLELDFGQVTVIDPAFVGLCLLLSSELISRQIPLKIQNPSESVRMVFRWNNADELLIAQ